MQQAFAALVLSLIVPSVGFADPANQKVDYLRDIKPILRGRCYGCHGVVRQKSGLRLDTAALIRKGGENGPAIVPGKAEESWLIEVVTGKAGFRMPPEDEGEPLKAKEISLLKAWINRGAKSPNNEKPQTDPRQHWSYQTPVRPPVPQVQNAAWVLNPIDAFIAAKHAELKLKPRPAAEKHTLLRRVYLDLIGIPPTREQLHAFLADSSPGAYETVVDRLLTSPLYGQRWGRHWMDVWRYSDWYGRRPSNEIRYSQRHIWRWRDWIIESVNDDKGYDRMLVEMLAGDEVAPTDNNVLRATGFLGRNWYKFDRNVWLFDTVERTSMGLLALNMRCCRCHDHKFDPISQLDYYRFRAFFEPHAFRTERLSAGVGTEVDNGKAKVLKDGLARVYDAKLDAATFRFIRGDDRRPDKKHPLTPAAPASFGKISIEIKPVTLPPEAYIPGLRPGESQALIAVANDKVKAAETALKKSKTKAGEAKQKVDAAELAKRAAASGGRKPSETPNPPDKIFLADTFDKPRTDVWKPVSGEWKYSDGRLVQSLVTQFATMVSLKNHPRNFQAKVKYRTLEGGTYRSVGVSFDYVDGGNSQDVYTSSNNKGTPQTVQAFHRTGGKQVYPNKGIVKTKLTAGNVTTLDITVHEATLKIELNGKHMLDYALPIPRRDGKFALWVHAGAAEFLELQIKGIVPTLADLKRAQKIASNQVAINEKKVATAKAELAAVKARIDAERAKHAHPADARAKALAVVASRSERSIAVAVADQELLIAELAPDKVKKVEAARKKLKDARAALAKADGTYKPLEEKYPRTSTGRRLALARWFINPKNPRTARVAVNQIWLRHFSHSFVEPVDDFGPRSKPRSHPELLDWLAVELVENGWSTKHLHRLIVTSNTYRMKSSNGSRENPNLAIDPDNRYLWRTNSRRMEAEVVRDSLLATAEQLDFAMGGPDLDDKQGQTSRRRSLYFRTTPDNKMELLELFDLANPNECYRRRESVVPQQALAMTNSAVALSQARLLARQLSDQVGSGATQESDVAFVSAAFEQVLGRAPTRGESAACNRFLERHTKLLQQTKALTAFASGGQSKLAPATDPHLRARENLVHVLFSHNDFVTIR